MDHLNFLHGGNISEAKKKSIMKEIIREIRKKLSDSVSGNQSDGILFSGGLDSTVLAALKPNVKAINISLESYGEDINYAERAAKLFNLDLYKISIEIDEAIKAIPVVIGILRSFDPAIPNDLAVYFGLKYARDIGLMRIMTGDGADEFFAGYDFMRHLDYLDQYIRRISLSPIFSSNDLGKFFNVRIIQPFLHRDFIKFILEIPLKFKIRKERDKIHGKWILRKAFEDQLSGELAWQGKRPIEFGSGMNLLREIICSKISDKEFNEAKKEYPVKFLNKEHLYYYRIYLEIVGRIPGPLAGQNKCPGCGAGMNPDAFHCKICGNILDWR